MSDIKVSEDFDGIVLEETFASNTFYWKKFSSGVWGKALSSKDPYMIMGNVPAKIEEALYNYEKQKKNRSDRFSWKPGDLKRIE